MAGKYRALVFAASQMQREAWLLYLNYLLEARRSGTYDPRLCVNGDRASVPPHVVRFLAQLIIRHGTSGGGQQPTWDWFIEMRDLTIGLPDPIQDDPHWKSADPTGFFVRIHNQQSPSQETRRVQRLGLAASLFCDLPPLCCGFSLKEATESALGMSVEDFMRLGLATMSFQAASCGGHACAGTFSREYLAKAEHQGVRSCRPELWAPFLDRVCATPTQFREECESVSTDFTNRYQQFAFNPLQRRPVIETARNCYIAPDPYLLAERTSLGIFYDLFEKEGVRFTESFGYCFERLVENIIRSTTPLVRLWTSERYDSSERKVNPPSKLVDLAIGSAGSLVLLECKSFRTSLQLATRADEQSLTTMVDRIADALAKCVDHSGSIASGAWVGESLEGREFSCVIVTYGKLHAVNSPFVREAVLRDARFADEAPPRWVVLALEELDAAASLVESGRTWWEVMSVLCSDNSAFDPLSRHFGEELRLNATSTFSSKRGEKLWDTLLAEKTSD